MSDQNQATELPPEPVKQRRKRGPNRPKAAATVVKPSPFIGMTRANCCDGCHKGHCVVSNNTYCAHPYKGGLQTGDLIKHEAVKRYAAAKAYLAHQAIKEG